MLQRGSRLGKYEIIEQIGSGGMGAVYRARDPILGREVAIKVIAGSVESPDFVARFYAEAKATARLQHPNILPVFEFGEDQVGEDRGTTFLVMPFLRGRTLQKLLAQTTVPVPFSITKTILEQVASALDYAHSQGIVHRDVKPANIMIDTETNGAILMDFGIARMNTPEGERLTRTGALLGTVAYIAPEQILGREKEVGGRTDQYALALIAFQMLTGRLPFAGKSDFEVLDASVRETPPLVTDLRADLPASTAFALARALAKNPADRFDLVTEFVDAAFGAAATHAASKRIKPPNILLPFESVFHWLSRFGRLFRGRSAGSPTPVSADAGEVAGRVLASATETDQSPSDATMILPVPISPSTDGPTNAGLDSQEGGGATRIFHVIGDGKRDKQGDAWDSEQVVEERPRIQLVFKRSADPLQVGESVKVDKLPFRIGRADADLSIPADIGMSRHQAEIDWINGTYVVRDMGSRNGTFIQGRRVYAQEALRFGDSIRLSGATELTLVSDRSTTVPDFTGAVLDGRYTLIRLIRTTGKAAIYEATDTRLPHKVAVKVLSPTLAHYPGYLDDFQYEARMAAELQHPHIVRVLDSGAVPLNSPSPLICNYVCLELMPEGDLADLLRERSTLPLGETLEILDGVSDALEYAHGLGIVHRGLKPSSILFGRNMFVFVSDFAFAARSSDPERRMFLGAPDFLAPEQWEGGTVTAAADQYSLTALAYLMLTGSPPHRGQQDPDIRGANLLRGPFPAHEEAARKGNPDIPTTVSDVLARALSPDPASRYPSIREFFLRLKRAAGPGAAVRDGPPLVFISYQRDTSAGWAVLFSRELEQKYGINAFVDTQRTDSAVKFPARLNRAIRECDIFVCLLSDKTLGSQWVREEVRLAWENNKPMVPVFQESFEQPASSEKLDGHIEALISFEGIHLLDRRNIYVDDAISRLASMVKQSVRAIRDTPPLSSKSKAAS